MFEWRSDLFKRVESIEKSNRLDTFDKVYNFFKSEFEELVITLINSEEVSKIEDFEDSVYFFIYEKYFRLQFKKDDNEIDVYVPYKEGSRKYATIFINQENETYARLEPTETSYDNTKHYIDKKFVDRIFELTYRHI